MTTAAVIPSLRYKDAHAAIAWLVAALGFTAQAVYEGPDNTVEHAQLTLGRGMIMLGSGTADNAWNRRLVHPADIGERNTGAIYLVVPDCAAVYATAQAAGANILAPIEEMSYGGKAFSCLDPEGQMWSVGEYDPWA